MAFKMFLPMFLQLEFLEALWTRKRLDVGVCGHMAFKPDLRIARERTLRAPKRLVLLHVLEVIRLMKEVRATELALPGLVHGFFVRKTCLKRRKGKTAILALVLHGYEGENDGDAELRMHELTRVSGEVRFLVKKRVKCQFFGE